VIRDGSNDAALDRVVIYGELRLHSRTQRLKRIHIQARGRIGRRAVFHRAAENVYADLRLTRLAYSLAELNVHVFRQIGGDLCLQMFQRRGRPQHLAGWHLCVCLVAHSSCKRFRTARSFHAVANTSRVPSNTIDRSEHRSLRNAACGTGGRVYQNHPEQCHQRSAATQAKKTQQTKSDTSCWMSCCHSR
jgi:hypothetical protein